MNPNRSFQLSRNTFGRLVLTDLSGGVFEGVVPVRSFPITDPQQGIALIDAQGHEVAWIECLDDLPQPDRALIDSELTAREFMPEIKCLLKVSSFAAPSSWQVMTDRGEATLVLKGEEDIRRLTASSLLIRDQYGISFLIQDRLALDRHSRKLLDHFL